MNTHNLSGGDGGPTFLRAPRQGPHRDPHRPSSISRGKGNGGGPSLSPFHKDHRQEHEALEAERQAYQEARRQFTIEVREFHEGAKRDQQLLADKLRSKAEQQLTCQLQQLRQETTRQREAEMRLLLRWKEAELREAREFLKQERDATTRQARDLQGLLAKELVNHGSSHASLEEVLSKLRREVDGDQAARIRHLEAELELERRLFRQFILRHFEEKSLPAGALPRFRPASQPPKGKVNNWGAAGELPQEGLLEPGGLSENSYKQLRKQNTDMSNSLKVLEGRSAHLEEENALLRKGSFPDMQERAKTLKTKGVQLAAIASRLEEAAKKLQESNLRVHNGPVPLALHCSERKRCEKVFARQEAKDLTEQSSHLLAKDHQVEALQMKCEELRAELSSRNEKHSSSSIRDLNVLLQESEREVLRLRRQLEFKSQGDSLQTSPIATNGSSSGIIQEASSTIHVHLEDSSLAKKSGESQTLTFSEECHENGTLERDSKGETHLQLLEKQLAEKQRQCESLMHEAEAKQKRRNEVELKLHKMLSENARLSAENFQLRGKNKRAEKMANENADLKVKMIQEPERRNSVQLTQGKVENLEQVTKNIEERTGRQQQLESKKTEPELRKQEDETEPLEQVPIEITKEHDEEVQFPETQVKELDPLFPSQTEHVNLLNPEVTSGKLEEWETDKVSTQLQSDNLRPFRRRRFFTRHRYDPFNVPNKNTEVELPLTAREYVCICGEMDAGGRRGFVPSHSVEEVIPLERSDVSYRSFYEPCFPCQSASHEEKSNSPDEALEMTFAAPSVRPPYAPLDVQVKAGSSADILVISWLPETIHLSGSSNGVKITGYAVYISGQKVTQITSPTAGSVSLKVSQINMFQGPPSVSVRTVSPFGESVDSVPVLIPSDLLKAPGTESTQSVASGLTFQEVLGSEGESEEKVSEACLTQNGILQNKPDNRKVQLSTTEGSCSQSSLESRDANSLSPASSLSPLEFEMRKDTDVGTRHVCSQDTFPGKNRGTQIKRLCKELSKLTVSPVEAQEGKSFRRRRWQAFVGAYCQHSDLSEEEEEEDEESPWCMTDEDVCMPQETPESPTEGAKEKILMRTLRAEQTMTHSISNSGPQREVASGASVNSGTSRLSVALLDHDPTATSPNLEAGEEEERSDSEKGRV